MIAHTSVAVSDYAKARDLYAAMLAPVGYKIAMDLPEYNACGFEQGGKRDFWFGVGKTLPVSGVHVAFQAESKEQVDAFYAAGLAAGATDNGAPGYRTEYAANYYGAFLYDLDGNNIEAVWFDPTK